MDAEYRENLAAKEAILVDEAILPVKDIERAKAQLVSHSGLLGRGRSRTSDLHRIEGSCRRGRQCEAEEKEWRRTNPRNARCRHGGPARRMITS